MKQKSLLIISYRELNAIVAIVALTATLAVLAKGQDIVTGTIDGAVVDGATGFPIAGASVRIVNDTIKVDAVVLTDSRGRFYRGQVVPGRYEFHFSSPGYLARDITQRVRIGSNEFVPVPVTLEPDTPPENQDQNKGAIAVASVPNALVQVEALDGGTIFKRSIGPDQLLCVFDELPPNRYKVSASLEGYQPAQGQVTVLVHRTVPLTLSLSLSETSARIRDQAGKYYALIIGNNSYQNMNHLLTAENDARVLEMVLRERYGFETKLLLNANRTQVMTALSEYRHQVEENSNLFIYFAGHGYNDREVEKTYWLPVDAGRENNGSWISADDITINLKGIRARHVLVVSDSCYSGTLARSVELTATSAPAASGEDKYLLRISAAKSRMLMASGGDEPVADSGGAGHSVFANALLSGLMQMDRDIFLGRDLFRDFVAPDVSGKSNQTPEYSAIRNSGHESGDFIFIRKKQ